ISEIKKGDIVKSFSNGIEYKKVIETFCYSINEPVYKITYLGKEIISTFDHKFSFGGSWVKLKDIVSLWHARNLEANTRVYPLPCKRYRSNKDVQLEGERQRSYNETRKRQVWILKNNAKRRRWEIPYCEGSSNNSPHFL